jgi:hypothetical protein
VDFPVIAASGGSAYLTWTDSVTGSIRLSVSHDHGATWTTTTMGSTTRSTPDGRDGSPFVAVDGSRATIAWTGDANGAVVTRTTTNGGGVWTAARTLATTSNGLVTTAVRGTRSAVAWSTGRTIQVRILSGSIWGAVLSTTPPGPDAYYNRSWFPAVALQGTTSVAVAFSACVGPCPASSARLIDVVWAESLDGGGTWKRQVIGFYNNGGGPQKVSPSVLWATPTLRYVMWNGQPFDGGLGLAVRTGSGAP